MLKGPVAQRMISPRTANEKLFLLGGAPIEGKFPECGESTDQCPVDGWGQKMGPENGVGPLHATYELSSDSGEQVG